MWACVETRRRGRPELHVLPEGDGVGHWADDLCLCGPSKSWTPGDLFGGGGWLVTHNSFDGREANEGVGDDSPAGNLEWWVSLHESTATRGTRTAHQARH
jgi:hypothetical protein